MLRRHGPLHQEPAIQDLPGKVAVVTGAASCIGLAMGEAFSREGMKVVLADIEQQALDTAVTELSRQEYDVLGVRTDVSRPSRSRRWRR